MSLAHRPGRLVTALISSIIIITTGVGLADASPAQAPARPAVVSFQTVRLGDSGDTVQAVQLVLRSYGYSITVDGQFGPVTLDRVMRWQRSNGLVVDGIVGPQTLASLGLSGSPASAPTLPSPVSNAPKAPSVPTYNGGATGADQWHNLALNVGWTEAQWPHVRCIISRESNGIPSVVNSIGATGLMQILARYYPGQNLKDPRVNLTIGLQLYNSRGWQPWYHPTKPCY